MTSYSFKVVLLGQGCVGKTSLVLRYVSNVFNDSHQSTLQASFLKKQLYLDQDLIRLNIWDTAGQEKFHALGPIYYREAQGALLVYDVTSPDSLRKVRDWVRELNKMLGTHSVRLAIIGNKVDLLLAGQAPGSEQKVIQSSGVIQEAVRLADELQNARHYLTSAKLNEGIGELFVSLSRRMIEQQKRLLASRRDGKTILASSRLTRMAPESELESDSADADQGPGASMRVVDRTRGAESGASSCQC